jgi:hypothetical protein
LIVQPVTTVSFTVSSIASLHQFIHLCNLVVEEFPSFFFFFLKPVCYCFLLFVCGVMLLGQNLNSSLENKNANFVREGDFLNANT